MTTTPTNTDDIIDSRDIIERIEELETELEDGPLDDEDKAELAALKALAEEGSGYSPDWLYGETLIRYDYFETYAQDLAEDCGMIPDGLTWPLTCIDWEQAARELQYDYTIIDFDGVTYWVRSC